LHKLNYMKKIFLSILSFLFISTVLFSQENKPAEEKKPKAKHLLPNGEPDRPFTFFAKQGFAHFQDGPTSAAFAGRPAYFIGIGTRVEDDDKDSPLFMELEGLYHMVNGVDSSNKSLTDLRINLNMYAVLLTNTVKSFRWNAGTGFGWNSINDGFISKTGKQFGVNINTQAEMLLKHKRFNLFAGYHFLPFHNKNMEAYSFNTFNLGMGFYFR
jgi:hypothetical protein